MSDPLPYATPLPPGSRHDTIYTALLGALCAMSLLGTVMMGVMTRAPGQAPETVWVLKVVFVMYLVFLLLQVAVLIIRIAFPQHRKWPTVALNVFLLLWLPFGTALGIYGLWKADRGI